MGSELALVITSLDYDEKHAGWQQQRATLMTALERAGLARLSTKTAEGNKGAAQEIILALGSSGAIAAFVRIAYLFLRKPRRELKLLKSRTGDSELRVLILTEKDASSELDLKDALETFFRV